MESRPKFQAIARRFDSRSVVSIAVVGSHARGEAGAHSDIDIVRFVRRGTSYYTLSLVREAISLGNFVNI